MTAITDGGGGMESAVVQLVEGRVCNAKTLGRKVAVIYCAWLHQRQHPLESSDSCAQNGLIERMTDVNAIQTNEDVPGKGIILDPKSHTLALQCNYTEAPEKEIVWYKDGAPIPKDDKKFSINSDTNTLEINDPGYPDTGNYTCMVGGVGGENATIVVQTNVSIEVTEGSKNQVEGDPLTLSCKAFGVPIPVVTWLKDDEPLNISDPRITLEPLNNVSDAKLVIQDLNFDDRAQYTCVASNGISNETMTVLVRVKDKLAALWPFLGICVEVAVLCAIIFIYEKKRVKPDFEESDTDQNPENKNLSDQKEGQDIRQRK